MPGAFSKTVAGCLTFHIHPLARALEQQRATVAERVSKNNFNYFVNPG